MSNAANFDISLTEEELDSVLKEFLDGDTNSDGSLDFAEFNVVMANRVKVEGQLDALFKAFDVDGNGIIDFREFATALTITSKGTTEQKLKFVFGLYDVDKNGELTQDEVAEVLKHLKLGASRILASIGEEEPATEFAKSIVSKLDVNKDGKITLQEWVTVGVKTPAILSFLSPSV